MRTVHFFLSTFFLMVGLILMCAGFAGMDDGTLDKGWQMWFMIIITPAILVMFMFSNILKLHKETDDDQLPPIQ